MLQMMHNVAEILSGFNGWSVAFRIILAAIVGGCIGSERGRHGRAAGLRTHILVCLGATMTALVGLYTVYELGFDTDPMRIGAQVISGVGFLGAGTILTRNQSQITGLTTAAALWTTASLGLAIGVGFYGAVLIAFVVVLVTISVLTRLERSINIKHRGEEQLYYLELNDIARVNELFEMVEKHASDLQIIPPKSGASGHVGVTFAMGEGEKELTDALRERDYVVVFVPMAR